MSLVKKYNNLMNKFYHFKDFGFQNAESNVNNSIEKIAVDNLFNLYKKNSDDPQVIIFGFTHNNQSYDQQKELETILQGIIRENDVIMLEGHDPSEVIYEALKNDEDIITSMKEFLKSKNVRSIFNDDKYAIGNLLVASNKIKNNKNEKGEELTSDNYNSIKEKFMDSLNKRDQSMCLNKHTGIINLINRSADFYLLPHPEARYIQLTGVLHVLNGMIEQELENNNIDYMIFLPKNSPFKN